MLANSQYLQLTDDTDQSIPFQGALHCQADPNSDLLHRNPDSVSALNTTQRASTSPTGHDNNSEADDQTELLSITTSPEGLPLLYKVHS